MLLLTSENDLAQIISNKGSEFFAVFPTHVPDVDSLANPLLANISIFISSDKNSSGKIVCGNSIQTFTVKANGVTEIPIPRAAAYIDVSESGQVLSNRGIHIIVDDGQPKVVAYAHIFAGKRSAASLILPVEGLGQQYFSMNYQQYDSEGKNFIVITASEPETTIHIKKGNTELVPGGITLHQINDTYEYLSADDLTGTFVTVDSVTSACKHFAMYSGSSGVYINDGNCTPTSIDPLFQQCYPIQDWGKNYGFVPFSTIGKNKKGTERQAGQLVRILAGNNNTIVKINGNVAASLNSGQFYTTPKPLNTPAAISANQPVAVAQYALTQSCSDLTQKSAGDTSTLSDPDMVFLNPLAFNIKDITVYSSTREKITEQYINILLKSEDATSFRINDKLPPANFSAFAPLPGYSYAQLDVTNDSLHTFHLSCNGGFNAIAYGFGNVESYSYSAGTNLAALSALMVKRTGNNITIDSACVNDDYYFSLSLSYIAKRISWQMDAGETPTVQQNPHYTLAVDSNGLTSYVYTLQKTAAYQIPGIHQIKILADYAETLGGCSDGNVEIDGSFLVMPQPTASFSFTADSCSRTISFLGTGTTNGYGQPTWSWDFGDTYEKNDTSSMQNPTHTYHHDGTYIVSLTVNSEAGCATVKSDTIIISSGVIPNFTNTIPLCAGHTTVFTDSSQTNNFITAVHKWYFGDGDSVIVNNASSITHRYLQDGIYRPKMVLISNKGCVSDTVTKTIVVNALPQPDFVLPQICTSDAYAYFTNQTKFADTTALLGYKWNFGDPNATTDNPDTSLLKNPLHKYHAAQNYSVSLTVISPEGCDTTITKNLTVNGEQPIADFDIVTSTPICGGQDLVLFDKSHVKDFGSITRLEWVLASENGTAQHYVVNNLNTNNIYTYKIPAFYQPITGIAYQVKLLAYSGNSCADSVIKNFIVMPFPQLDVAKPDTLCVGSGRQTLNPNPVTNQLAGTGLYKGDGVVDDIFFDPSLAGAGFHLVKYFFTTINGCTDSAGYTINVLSEPAVKTGKEILILEGSSVTLKPEYSGTNLSYNWLPATGLNDSHIAYPTVTPTETTDYSITISNGYCQQSSAIQVKVLKKPVIYNTFTPNGDGINDVWNIPNLNDYPGATVQIFNRYGARLYNSVGYAKPWDGKFNNEYVPSGTYYYIIDPKNGQQVFSGYVTVLR